VPRTFFTRSLPGSLVRRLVYRGELAAQAWRFRTAPAPPGGWPALLGISFPKSGTHLLDQILLGFSRVAPFSRRLHSFYAEYEGRSGRKQTAASAIAWLNSLQPRDVASAHLFARPEVAVQVITPAFVAYFAFRDPRDVVVSHVFYVTEMEPSHVHHSYYSSLADFGARLTASIEGRPDAPVEFPDIARRFAPYLGWLDEPAVLPVRFEDLVNERAATLERVIDHLLSRAPLELPPARIRAALQAAINPQASPTFRSGRTGDWRTLFTPAHKALFKEVAGDLLIRLGYESNYDW
jgi:hypothetical protein